MCSSRLKESIISACCVLSVAAVLLLASAFPSSLSTLHAAPSASKLEEDHTRATLDIAVTLAGITAFQDFQELRAGLLKSEGVSRVVLVSEAPGLISFRVTYAGEAMGLIDKMTAFFPKKYDMREKRLPGGGSEVNISLKQRPAA